MVDTEFYPQQTGAREHAQPWGRQETSPYFQPDVDIWAEYIEQSDRKRQELERLSETGLRLRAIADFVLRIPELRSIGSVARKNGYIELARHIDDLIRRMSDATE